MTWVILEGPAGQRRVKAGVPFKLLPGEKPIGSDRTVEIKEENEKLERLAKERGVGVGELVTRLTKAFGIPPCAACVQRGKVLDRLRIVGWKITLDKVE